MPIRRLKKILIALVAVLLTSASAVEVDHSRSVISQSQSSPINRSDQRRLQWQLSESEWQRYQTLMQGMRGSISPATISPLEVLGTHAKTDQKRRHYARLWAKMMHDDVERILKFQDAYNNAWSQLYGNQPLIDISKLNLKTPQPESWKQGDRIALFVKTQQCTRCQIVVHHAAIRALNVGATLDLYFVATKPGRDDDLIRHWAQAASINAKDVKEKRITLNHEDGELMRFTGKVVTQFPVAFQINTDTIRPFPIDRIQ